MARPAARYRFIAKLLTAWRLGLRVNVNRLAIGQLRFVSLLGQ
jgi:hypothetical protein